MPFPFGHKPCLRMSPAQLRDFCPKCLHVRKWTIRGKFKFCKTCGIKIKKA